MKITAILGSPRKKGVSSSIALSFLEKAKTLGADANYHVLNKMTYQGCQACSACKSTREDCAFNDDLTPVLKDIETSDITVFATPIYYGDVTGQFKTFFDRTWSFVKPDYMTNPSPVRLDKGKKALLIISQGYEEEKHRDVPEKYMDFLKMYGYETHLIRSVESNMDDDEKMKPLIERAKDLATEMLA
ncbi:MAG: flavodoxin family protein [Desulfobacteraceae bacterium]|nr:flavodoxin family protein [Desulfobacteraceae bacterium]